MIEDIVARRYGAAFYQLSNSSGVAEKCLEELESMAVMMREKGELKTALTHPLIPRPTRKSIWKKISQQLGFHKVTTHFLALLIEKNRLLFLERICEFIREFIAESHNLNRVDLCLALPLDKKQEEALQERVKKSLDFENVEFSVSYNPSLIAGLVISYGDRTIDASLSGKLRKLHQQLI